MEITITNNKNNIFRIFDKLDFDDIEAGDIKPPVRVNLKRVSTGVVMRLILLPEIVEQMGIQPGDSMKLQGADMDEDIAFKISKSSMETKIKVRANTVGARKDDKEDLGVIINFNKMADFGAAAFVGALDANNRKVKNKALLIILPKGDNPVVAKKPRKTGGKGESKRISGDNPSGIVFGYYGNGKFKPTVESDAIMERMAFDEQKSVAEISRYFGNQASGEDIKRRLDQIKEFGSG